MHFWRDSHHVETILLDESFLNHGITSTFVRKKVETNWKHFFLCGIFCIFRLQNENCFFEVVATALGPSWEDRSRSQLPESGSVIENCALCAFPRSIYWSIRISVPMLYITFLWTTPGPTGPTPGPTGANARANGANARANARAQEIGPRHKLLLYQHRQDP